MNLLFIHGNFPGQFLDLAPYLARNAADRTVFLTESDNPQDIDLPGVEFVQFLLHRQPAEAVHTYLRPSEHAVLRGQAVLRAVLNLSKQGFQPDVAIVHGGQGYGLYLKTLLPKLRLISYMEWYFRPETSKHLFANFGLNDSLLIQTRNWPITQELVEADDIVSPTSWQRRQFPKPWSEDIKVIFDGVDTRLFYPASSRFRSSLSLKSGSCGQEIEIPESVPLLTYATRGMEPLRGFAEFMRAAAFAQQQLPNLHVVVAGNDRIAYSYASNHHSGSWKQQLLEELKDQLDLTRMHFPGLVNYGELQQLFHRSDLHCYFTRPYVISWGLFQVAACGCPLLVNRFPGVEDVFQDLRQVNFVDLDTQNELNHQVVRSLQMPIKEQQTSNLRHGLDLDRARLAWGDLLFNDEAHRLQPAP
jgi:glycosyltransferase involved in cell wall biosynthesis